MQARIPDRAEICFSVLFCFFVVVGFLFFFGGGVLPNELVSGTKIGFLFLSAENLVQGSVVSQ